MSNPNSNPPNPNDHRSNAKNPNSAEFEQDRQNRIEQERQNRTNQPGPRSMPKKGGKQGR